VLPALSVASLVGFGAVVAAMPAFALVRDWVLGIGGGPLVSLAAATNVLAVVTLLAVCGTTHRESYFDIVMVGIVGAIIALAVVIGLGSAFGSF